MTKGQVEKQKLVIEQAMAAYLDATTALNTAMTDFEAEFDDFIRDRLHRELSDREAAATKLCEALAGLHDELDAHVEGKSEAWQEGNGAAWVALRDALAGARDDVESEQNEDPAIEIHVEEMTVEAEDAVADAFSEWDDADDE